MKPLTCLLAIASSIPLSCLTTLDLAIAQIVPDTTLPINSLVTPNGNSLVIDGGTAAGNSLFHSFEQFSVSPGTEAFFNNALTIENIFSRVTGGSISQIDGLIRANGIANVFLLNPNGIVFGTNASLNIGGSFLGSTASSIKFADGSVFSATNPQAPPLLTVNVPVGLSYGSNPGTIINQSTTASNGQVVGLQVQPGRTISLVGGNVQFVGGRLTTPQGRVELGAVAGNSVVSLTPSGTGFILGYAGVENFQDVLLSQLAVVDTSGIGGGNIQVQGRRVSVTDGSQILAATLGAQPGGTLNITASDLVEVIGSAPLSGPLSPDLAASGVFAPQPSLISANTFGAGSGGNLSIQTRRLLVRDGGRIEAKTLGAGDGGDLLVGATESVEVVGKGTLLGIAEPLRQLALSLGLPETIFGESQTASGLSTINSGSGDGGDLRIETSRLIVRDGGFIQTTSAFTGAGGDLTVLASESVELLGTPANDTYSPGLSTGSLGSGAAGTLTIQTGRLLIQDGSGIGTSTAGVARGGDLNIHASESVELVGISPTGRWQSSLSANSLATGEAGDVSVTTGRLSIRDGATIIGSGTGSGAAGDINVFADSIKLDNQGSIRSTRTTGTGGNITLATGTLQLRHNSEITTNASGRAMGGDITINTDTLVALEDSDITANAVQGQGGNVQINAQGIFLSPDSEITASSELGINGMVETRTPDVNVQNDLTSLSNNFVSPEQAIASSCLARRNVEQGSFTFTGTGGLPQNPYEAISGQYRIATVQALPVSSQPQASASPPKVPVPIPWKLGDPIQEAQGMTVTPDGRIIVGTTPELVAIAQPKDLICDRNVQAPENSATRH